MVPGVPAELTELMVVGGGKMGEALVGGLLARGWAPPEAVAVVEQAEGRRQDLTAPGGLADRYRGLRVVPAVEDVAGPVAGAVLAVKPGDVETACRALADRRVPMVLSIAAGVGLAALEGWLPQGCAVVRAMPNTAALVGEGAAAVAGGTAAGAEAMAWAEGVLSSVGVVVTVAEPALDAVTGLSGSGPAYVFLMAEALIDAGVLAGLPRPVAHRLAVQTLLGAARLLSESGNEPVALRAAVTSPGGTTAAGLHVLEAAGVRAAVADAVLAAAERSRELGRA